MPGLIIQFHALPEELLPILQWSVKDLAVHVTAFRFFPFQAEELRPDMLGALLLEPSICEVALTLGRPSLPVTRKSEFLDNHPEALCLDIGRLSEKGLDESCLSCRDADAHSLGVWRKIANKLRKITKAGVRVTSPTTGTTGGHKNHRYTAGAKALDDKGVPILPVAGGAILHLGEPPPK